MVDENVKRVGILSPYLLVIILLAAQLQSLQQESEVSIQYINFYLSLRNLVTPVLLFAVCWSFIKQAQDYGNKFDWMPTFGSVYSLDEKTHPYADTDFKQKLWVFIAFAGSASFGLLMINSLFAASAGGIVFFPIPQIMSSSYQMTPSKTVFLTAVPPGFYEDALYNLIMPSIVLSAITFLALKLGFDLDDKNTMITCIVFACLISSSGVSIWLVPGFSSAHQVYATNSPAFISVFIFGFVASLLNLLFGMFGSFLAHMAHNAFVSISQSYNIQYWGITLGAVGPSADIMPLQGILIFIIALAPIGVAWIYNKLKSEA
jgi:hypothetical protein